VPKAKATMVADTPEMMRLAANTKNQSNVQYHAEFEASKSKFTAVTDDPESKRLAANSRTISNISYHGLVEQKEHQEKKRSIIGDDKFDPPAPVAAPVSVPAPSGTSLFKNIQLIHFHVCFLLFRRSSSETV
jgi:hypothetical protein